MRPRSALLGPLLALALAAAAAPGQAAEANPTGAAPAVGAGLADPAQLAALDAAREAHARVDRRINLTLLVGGLVSVAAGAVMMIPDSQHQAWRFAGGATIAFGAIDALLAALALPGGAATLQRWRASAADRRSAAGFEQARRGFAGELERLGLLYALNLGLDVCYAGVSGMAVGISQLSIAPADSDRWLAIGLAGLVQSVFLIGIDTVGLLNAHRRFDRVSSGLAPTVSLLPGGGMAGGLAWTF